MTDPAEKSPAEKFLEQIFGRSSSESEKKAPATSEEAAILKDKVEKVLATLTFREREIIKLRYGIGDGYTYTLEEVGRMFKATRERVRQIEANGLRKLQHPVRARKIEGYLDTFGSESEGTA